MADGKDLIERAILSGGLRARYQQSHRHYHNLEHIEYVLDAVDSLTPGSHGQAIRLAAWFHDAVYAPGRDDNEERSAFVAAEALEVAGASPSLISEVVRLVLVTKDHDPTADDKAGAILSDADLRILASDSDTYARYAANVRREYELIPDDVFFPARLDILRQFVTRPRLFATPFARGHWEPDARRNVAAEIDKLTEMT
jgi:predicted metal-dependent HD superfamily phosphohydrolase